jgi:hypothetical protein
MTAKAMTAHYKGDDLAGTTPAHTFTHCEIEYRVYRTADGKRVRVVLASPQLGDDGEWALDADADSEGYLRIRRASPHSPFTREFLMGIVGRVQGELYDGRDGAVYTVSGPAKAAA